MLKYYLVILLLIISITISMSIRLNANHLILLSLWSRLQASNGNEWKNL